MTDTHKTALAEAGAAVDKAIADLEAHQIKVPTTLRQARTEIAKTVSNSFGGNGHSGAIR